MKKAISIVLAAVMFASLGGCGKGSPDSVGDYGNLPEGTSVTKSQTSVDNSITEDSSEIARCLGVNKLEYVGSFDVSGNEVSVHIDAPLPEVGKLPTYKVRKMTPGLLDEEAIVKKFFGDTARKATDKEQLRLTMPELTDEEIDRLMQGETVNVYEGDKLVGTIEGPSEESLEESAGSEGEQYHTYLGKYKGTDFLLEVNYYPDMSSAFLSLEPVNPGEFLGNSSLRYMNVYDPIFSSITGGLWTTDGTYIEGINTNMGVDEEGNPIIITSENIEEYDIGKQMADSPNTCTASEDVLLMETESFLDEMLGVTMPSGVVKLYSASNKLDGIDLERSGIDASAGMSELVFSEENTYPKINYSTAVRNGYLIGLDSTIAGLEPYYGRDPWNMDGYQMNNGEVKLTDRGVIGFNYFWKYYFDEELSPDSELLKFDSVMESFEEGVKQNVMLGDYGVTKMAFNEMHLTYVLESSAYNPAEMAYVPAWAFMGYNNGNAKTVVYINAIDGSFISADRITDPEDF